jgi:uncharacterized damage-inducible protein DinB
MPVATVLATAAHIFKRNKELLAKAIDGLTAEQWHTRPGESSNSALWIVGHLVWARSRALQFIGYTWTKPWLNLFERGSRPADTAQYPSVEEVLDAWEDLCTSFPAALEEVPEATLSAPAPQPSPSLDGTVGGMVSFLAMHETYHVGQFVYLRRILGHDRVVG